MGLGQVEQLVVPRGQLRVRFAGVLAGRGGFEGGIGLRRGLLSFAVRVASGARAVVRGGVLRSGVRSRVRPVPVTRVLVGCVVRVLRVDGLGVVRGRLRVRRDVEGGGDGDQQSRIDGQDGVGQAAGAREEAVEGSGVVTGRLRVRRPFEDVRRDERAAVLGDRVERDGQDCRQPCRVDAGIRVPDGEAGGGVEDGLLLGGPGQGDAQAVGAPRAVRGSSGQRLVRGDREGELRLLPRRHGARQLRKFELGTLVLVAVRLVRRVVGFRGGLLRGPVGADEEVGGRLLVDPLAHVVAHRHAGGGSDDGQAGGCEVRRRGVDDAAGHRDRAIAVHPWSDLVEDHVRGVGEGFVRCCLGVSPRIGAAVSDGCGGLGNGRGDRWD
ncbi:hypothetical protein [Brevibacterium senegalense]|uniref:hypothetical protein n=1 Tax=Brevibacterium senegalense TaxID=1033736 RepID=UPI0028FCF664|nr:hypothetical protein [Brevibacterium senegalense]